MPETISLGDQLPASVAQAFVSALGSSVTNGSPLNLLFSLSLSLVTFALRILTVSSRYCYASIIETLVNIAPDTSDVGGRPYTANKCPSSSSVLLYVHRDHKDLRTGGPGWPPRLSHSSCALRFRSEMIYIHRARRSEISGKGYPGRPPRLSHSS